MVGGQKKKNRKNSGVPPARKRACEILEKSVDDVLEHEREMGKVCSMLESLKTLSMGSAHEKKLERIEGKIRDHLIEYSYHENEIDALVSLLVSNKIRKTHVENAVKSRKKEMDKFRENSGSFEREMDALHNEIEAYSEAKRSIMPAVKIREAIKGCGEGSFAIDSEKAVVKNSRGEKALEVESSLNNLSGIASLFPDENIKSSLKRIAVEGEGVVSGKFKIDSKTQSINFSVSERIFDNEIKVNSYSFSMWIGR